MKRDKKYGAKEGVLDTGVKERKERHAVACRRSPIEFLPKCAAKDSCRNN